MNSTKTVFITGANRGIGKEIFTSFVKKKFNVICSVRKKTSEFENYIAKFEKTENQFIRILEFDIDDHDKVKSEVQKLYKDKIILDVLVNNPINERINTGHGNKFKSFFKNREINLIKFGVEIVN